MAGIPVNLFLQSNRNSINLKMGDIAGTNANGTKSDQVTEEPEGILQLIDKLEDIVDQIVTG